MVPEYVLLRYGEIFLKGKNRSFFEKRLIDNIKKITEINKVKKLRSRLIADYFPKHSKLKNVFGLTSYSPAFFADKDMEKIKEKALSIIKNKQGSFKIETKRSDKTFPLKSPEINVLVGEFIEKNTNLKFSFENAENILKIEINQQGAYFFFDTIQCFGGLPTGVEGEIYLLVENEASLLAGLLMMKRGCSIVPLSSRNKDISLLQKFSPEKLELNAINDLYKLKEEVLVIGQNFDNLKKYDPESMIFRPLIAYSDKKIEEELRFYS